MFEKASKMKLRFDTPRGAITVEDLWDLPLSRGAVNLDSIAKDLYLRIKEEGEVESFVSKEPKKIRTILQLGFDIVTHIIDVKLKNVDIAEKSAATKVKKQKILEIIANKKDEDLMNSDINDLEKMLADL